MKIIKATTIAIVMPMMAFGSLFHFFHVNYTSQAQQMYKIEPIQYIGKECDAGSGLACDRLGVINYNRGQYNNAVFYLSRGCTFGNHDACENLKVLKKYIRTIYAQPRYAQPVYAQPVYIQPAYVQHRVYVTQPVVNMPPQATYYNTQNNTSY